MKYILITGAGGGMGASTAKHLAAEGYTVFALDKNASESGENIIPIFADVTDEESIRLAFGKIREITDELFAVIHFAGLYMLDSLVELGTEEYDRIFNVNIRGVYLINKIFLPLLSKGSRIVITTSELAPLDPLPFTGIYAITKSALDKYAYSLRMELQLLGIHVSVLRAGAVETSMLSVSTDALDRFCESTKLYSCNAESFKAIVENVEARSVSPKKIGQKMSYIIGKKKPGFAYSINRNPLLLMLNILPSRLQFYIIKNVLHS